MTLRLILMRHAKSDWGGINQSDHGRGLNQRGVLSAQALGNWLRDQNYLPDLVLSSDATRTRETFSELALKAKNKFLRPLYLAPSEAMLSVLQTAGTTPTVLMLGHNPGIADLAERLVNAPVPDPNFGSYPSCATSVIDFDLADWQEVDFGTGQLCEFTVPRRLLT